ncbi:MAG: ABC-F family ATP-binding cassette domain-containing protein, partial [Proteobacteria bacterium]|nr:ABC-F family ATP-binding cassette domain-containing protein [Pseudomonadota bacterium]
MLHINDLTYRIAGKLLFEDASAHVPAGHRVGLVGRNGTGKTTLLRLIMGEIAPDGGRAAVRRGASVAMLAQEAPGGSHSVLDEVLAADHERTALLNESVHATDPNRVAEIHTRLNDIGAHAAPSRAASVLAGLGFNQDEQGQ